MKVAELAAAQRTQARMKRRASGSWKRMSLSSAFERSTLKAPDSTRVAASSSSALSMMLHEVLGQRELHPDVVLVGHVVLHAVEGGRDHGDQVGEVALQAARDLEH